MPCYTATMESSNSRPLAGEINHYNNVNLHHSFKNTACDEINYTGDLPYQTEFNPRDQQQQFKNYSDNQMLTDQQLIGGSNYGGVDDVNLFPQSQEESLYFQRRKEKEEEHRVLEMRRQFRLLATNEPNPLKRKRLLYEMQQQQKSDELRRRQIDQNRPVITVDLQALCMKRVDMYIKYQKNRPKDNNIEYWWKFVSEFFHPQAKKRWCVSLYSKAHQTTQGVWHCELCNKKPGKGFEADYPILANLFKIKYDNGVIEEVLALDDAGGRYCTVSERVTLYARAVQTTIYEKHRVVREGRLLVDFSPQLKIISFEFCAVRHEEFIPRKLILPQTETVADKCIRAEKSTDETELRSACSEFVSLARRLKEYPTLNEYGYDKRYVMALMINGVLEAKGPIMDFSYATGIEHR